MDFFKCDNSKTGNLLFLFVNLVTVKIVETLFFKKHPEKKRSSKPSTNKTVEYKKVL